MNTNNNFWDTFFTKNDKSFAIPYKEIFKQISKHKKIKTVADVGCGNGELIEFLSKHNYIVDGYDFSIEALKLAEKRNKKYVIRLFNRDLNNSTLEKEYDAIILNSILPFIDDVDTFIKEICSHTDVVSIIFGSFYDYEECLNEKDKEVTLKFKDVKNICEKYFKTVKIYNKKVRNECTYTCIIVCNS